MEANDQGEFERKESKFRNWVKADGSTPYLPEAGRYHLYVSYACPWASRTLLVRSLRKLEDVISFSWVEPEWGSEGWQFKDGRNLIDIYRQVDPNFKDDETVPILWDLKTSTIVNNESRDILRMLDVEFREFGDKNVNFCPDDLKKEIDRTLDSIYEPINNGVYRAGFAETQSAYEKAVKELFRALDHYEDLLSRQRYLCGNQITEADFCLFSTLVRFDAVYVGHFKCNLRCLREYPNLWAYTRDLYQTPGVSETVDFDHIKRHYYCSHEEINPTKIVPLGPVLDFLTPHNRERFVE